MNRAIVDTKADGVVSADRSKLTVTLGHRYWDVRVFTGHEHLVID